jgi:Domain of unknown function (DUF4375)
VDADRRRAADRGGRGRHRGLVFQLDRRKVLAAFRDTWCRARESPAARRLRERIEEHRFVRQMRPREEFPPAAGPAPESLDAEGEAMDRDRLLIELSESPRTQFGKVDFAEQAPEQQVFSAVWALESEVNNGGFQQYFQNQSGETAGAIVAALERIGARRTAAIVAEALAAFPGGPPPPETGARRRRLASASPEALETWARLDEAFFSYPDNLTELLYEFVRSRPETFGKMP